MKVIRLVMSALCGLLAVGCMPKAPRPNVVPLATVLQADPLGPSKRLIVMLPGLRDEPRVFIDQGFVRALRERRIRGDVLIADTHFGYFEDRSIETRLQQDVILPAKARGYREIWLVGVSLGGFGSLAYATRHWEDITGILLIAPFPGTREVTGEIQRAGGPMDWIKTDQAYGPDERVIWRWLANYAAEKKQRPALYLVTGDADRYIEDQRMLASLLPPENLRIIKGRHDWPVWQQLWAGFLDQGRLSDTAAALAR